MQYIKPAIINLANQFQKAYSIKNFKWDSKIYQNLLIEWIEEREEIGNKYTELLDEFNIDFRTPEVAEVGKSSFDTIALSDPNTSIVTLDSKRMKEFNTREDRIIIPGTLRVYNNYEIIIEGLNKGMINNPFNCYMTQNPYEEEELKNWHFLVQRGNDIIAGVYGNIKENDSIKKIKALESLSNKLKDDQIISAFDINDKYYAYAISTKSAKTSRTKTR